MRYARSARSLTSSRYPIWPTGQINNPSQNYSTSCGEKHAGHRFTTTRGQQNAGHLLTTTRGQQNAGHLLILEPAGATITARDPRKLAIPTSRTPTHYYEGKLTMTNPHWRKQMFTLIALRSGISLVDELGANELWSEKKVFCAAATLMPGSTAEEKGAVLTDPTWWDQFDRDVLYMTANENNAFQGTDHDRRTHMLVWINEKYTMLSYGVPIITQASDLRVPHFTVPDPNTRPVTSQEVTGVRELVTI